MPANGSGAARRQFAVRRHQQFRIRHMNLMMLHCSPSTFVGAADPGDRPLKRIGHRAQRDAQYLRDLPIAQAFGAQMQALLILLGQGSDHGKQSKPPLRFLQGRIRPDG